MKLIDRMGAAAVAVVVAAGIAGAAQAAEWKGWNIHVPDYPNTVAMDKFAELLDKNSDGRITLKMFHGGVLGSQPDAIEQLRIGAIEIGNFNLGPIGPVAPEANVVSLPFIFKNQDHMHRAMDGAPGEQISAGMEKIGIVALAWYDSGARSFYNTKKIGRAHV